MLDNSWESVIWVPEVLKAQKLGAAAALLGKCKGRDIEGNLGMKNQKQELPLSVQ